VEHLTRRQRRKAVPQLNDYICVCCRSPKCRHDHKLKQHPKWKVDQLPDGALRWTTPSVGRLPHSELAADRTRGSYKDKGRWFALWVKPVIAETGGQGAGQRRRRDLA